MYIVTTEIHTRICVWIWLGRLLALCDFMPLKYTHTHTQSLLTQVFPNKLYSGYTENNSPPPPICSVKPDLLF